MVTTQLVSRGISEAKVLDAFRRVPRHEFVPQSSRAFAYDDCALPIGQGQTISQPYMVAVMTEKLGLSGQEKVLEVGSGSGYQAAILAELCNKVYTIERLPDLSQKAAEIVKSLGNDNVEFIVGDGTEGYATAAPYDAIIVTAGCPGAPQPLLEQLKDGGRLVLPIGNAFQQILTTLTKQGDKFTSEESVPCVFVPLLGKYGWK